MTETTRMDLPMPMLGETMDQGTITQWLVTLGQAFKRGDALLELETDKTLVEYPALGDGTLIETLAAPGEVVQVGTPIAVIDVTEIWVGLDKQAQSEPAQPVPETPKQQTVAASDSLRATPVARHLARQAGIGLKTLHGTGRRGRIELHDVEAAMRPLASPPLSRQAKVPFLFIHGFGGTGANWADLRAGLQRAARISTAPDLPGHGQNVLDAACVEDLSNWLTSLLADGPDPVHLVGHSLGAHICAVAAARYPRPVAHLTLIAPAGCGPEINGSFLHGLAGAVSPGGLAHLMRLLGPKAAALGQDALAAMAAELGQGRLTALAQDMLSGDRQLIDTINPILNLVKSIPVQAIFGAADAIVPKEHLFNMPPQVACHVLRSGHMPHWDVPDLMGRLLTGSELDEGEAAWPIC